MGAKLGKFRKDFFEEVTTEMDFENWVRFQRQRLETLRGGCKIMSKSQEMGKCRAFQGTADSPAGWEHWMDVEQQWKIGLEG